MTLSKSAVYETIGTPSAVLEVNVRDRSNNRVYHFRDTNMIMRTSKVILASLVSGDGVSSSPITKIVFGTTSTAPTPDDYAIGGIITSSLVSGVNTSGSDFKAYLKALAGHTYPDTGRVEFNWSLGFGEANGLAICEYGLISEDLTMFSRKTRGLVEKDSGLAMDGSWTIIF